jgi:hypothetical protein
MSKELIENLLEYADIAEAGEKSHWAKAMRQAAEYIMADLDKPLPEPDAIPALETYDAGILNDYGGGDVDWWIDYIRSELGAAHDFYQAQVDSIYAEPTARKPLTDEQIHDLWDIANGNLHKFTRAIEKAHGIKEQE